MELQSVAYAAKIQTEQITNALRSDQGIDGAADNGHDLAVNRFPFRSKGVEP